MENKPKISIIIPVYNAEKFLDRCMRSVLAQPLQDCEIILVNDGSTDSSGVICRKFRDADSRVVYIEKENGGAGSARNAGMQAAHGEYLAFPDADDWFEPEMYEKLYELAESGGYDMVFSGVNYYKQTADGKTEYSRTQNLKPLAFSTQDACRAHIMDFFPTTTIFDVPWNKLYKRQIAAENNLKFPDIRRCQDATFNIDFFNCIQSAASVDKAYYNYMENTVADVRRKFPKNEIDIVTFYYPHLIDILTSWGVYGGDIKTHYDTTFVLSVYSTADRYDNPLWKLDKAGQRGYVLDCLGRREIQEYLPRANVREDALPILEIVKNKDVNKLMKLHNREKRREAVRQNKLLIGIYRKIKG